MATRRSGRSQLLLKLLLAGAIVPLVGCSPVPQTTVFPLSDQARMIQELYVLIFWLAMFVFVVVEAVLIYSVIRYRRRSPDEVPHQLHGNTRLEIAWTIAPAIVLAFIGVPTISTIFQASQPAPADALHVRVVGHQWWWEFQYPELNVVTANEVHLPGGRPVRFDLESADVIHSFWIPRLGGKLDVVPNHVNQLVITPDPVQSTTTYLGQCVEFCGEQHANMKLRAVVHPADQFDAWVRSQQAAAAAPTSDEARRGMEVFMRSACIGCHTIAGTPAQGKVGPDLTHVGGRQTIAAGMIDNTPENLARWLRNPQDVKPGNKMPNLNLSEQDISLLVAYLESLK